MSKLICFRSQSNCSIQFILIGIQIFALLPSFAFGQEDLVPTARYLSARSAGIGESTLTLGEDTAFALFVNPADTGRIRKWIGEPLNASLNLNHDSISMLNSHFYSVTQLNSYASTLRSHPGSRASTGGFFAPSIAFPGIAIGALLQAQAAAEASADGSISYKSLYQVIPAIAVGYHFLHGLVRVGYNVQWVNQASGVRTLPSSADPVGYNQGLKQGSGFAHQFGLGFTLPVSFLPSLDVVVRNAFGTHFGSSFTLLRFTPSPAGLPEEEPMTLDASFGLHPRLGHGMTFHWTTGVRDFSNRVHTAMLGHLSVGGEIDWREKAFLRVGWKGGYPSAGIGFRRPGAEASFAWWSEEIGTHYLDQRDIKYVFQYQFRLL